MKRVVSSNDLTDADISAEWNELIPKLQQSLSLAHDALAESSRELSAMNNAEIQEADFLHDDSLTDWAASCVSDFISTENPLYPTSLIGKPVVPRRSTLSKGVGALPEEERIRHRSKSGTTGKVCYTPGVDLSYL